MTYSPYDISARFDHCSNTIQGVKYCKIKSSVSIALAHTNYPRDMTEK